MSRYRSAVLPIALLALVLAACGGGAADASSEPPASVAPASEAPESAAAASSDEPETSEAPEPSEAAEDEVRVRLEGFAFETDELTISAGTEVTFLNADSAAHTVTEGVDGQAAEDPIINEELAGNQATSFIFDEPGTYQITCLFHPSMNMTVVVEG